MVPPVLSPDGATGILLLNLQKIMANPLDFFFFSSNFSDHQGSHASLILNAFLKVAIPICLELGSFLSR